MLVVNLFGAPGAGKSTGAAYIFSRLKLAGINGRKVRQYSKTKHISSESSISVSVGYKTR